MQPYDWSLGKAFLYAAGNTLVCGGLEEGQALCCSGERYKGKFIGLGWLVHITRLALFMLFPSTWL